MSKKIVKPIGHNYTFVSEMNMVSLQHYKDHHRLGMFYEKGTVCVTCGVEGTRLIKSKDKGGGVHIDVYTNDLILMTVDHILPKSLGGKDNLDNKQPMCTFCNGKKGNTLPNQKKKTYSPEELASKKKAKLAKKFRKRVNKIVNKGFTFDPASVNINVLKVMKFNK